MPRRRAAPAMAKEDGALDGGRRRAGQRPDVFGYLASLCALLLVGSAVGPWSLEPLYVGNGSYREEVGPLGAFGLDRLLVPLAGLTALLGVPNPLSRDPERRRGSMGVMLAGFAAAGLLLVAFSDGAEASLGLGEWTRRGLGGVRRGSAWGWGTGLATWSIAAGLTLCLIAIVRRRARDLFAGAT